MPSIADGRLLTGVWVVGARGVWQGLGMKRFALLLPVIALLAGPAYGGPSEEALREGLRLASGKDWAGAKAAVAGVGGVAADLIEWQRLRGGDETARLGDYEAFLARRADWPGLALMRQKGEVAVARSTDPGRVIGYFGAGKPATAAGAIALVRALQAAGRPGEAEAEAYRAWAVLRFDPEEEAALLATQGEALEIAHEVRLDNLLWAGNRGDEALRMLPRVNAGWQALAKARMGLHSDKPGASALIEAVPAALKDDPGLAYERFLWRMRRDMYPEAAELLQERSDSAARLGRPEVWVDMSSTGVARCRSLWRMNDSNSSPLMSGMLTSVMTRSHEPRGKSRSAAKPLSASTTSSGALPTPTPERAPRT